MLSTFKPSSIKLSSIKAWARNLKRDSVALYLASRDPRVPWYAKAVAIAVAAYALSPIDLIPDFIPVLGYLDDLILLPLGIWLAIALVPDEVMAECRAEASAVLQRPISRAGMIAIIVLWIAGALALMWAAFRYWPR
ncbi:YkvA family protein [Bradyrhizobium sp. CER78]|uniref:YkvA family protein n=1 Tax=Bradyrhizobium sp. CER78 TaxID=3039162 RepID=UPI002447049D|nr:YkvA family protein [Bradyrhizobium sp. CER78]MDH2382347.1 YkvA family protein [Bradyrhizobium sp. CER78]